MPRPKNMFGKGPHNPEGPVHQSVNPNLIPAWGSGLIMKIPDPENLLSFNNKDGRPIKASEIASEVATMQVNQLFTVHKNQVLRAALKEISEKEPDESAYQVCLVCSTMIEIAKKALNETDPGPTPQTTGTEASTQGTESPSPSQAEGNTRSSPSQTPSKGRKTKGKKSR